MSDLRTWFAYPSPETERACELMSRLERLIGPREAARIKDKAVAWAPTGTAPNGLAPVAALEDALRGVGRTIVDDDEDALLAAGFGPQATAEIRAGINGARERAEYVLKHGSGPEDERALAVVRRLMAQKDGTLAEEAVRE